MTLREVEAASWCLGVLAPPTADGRPPRPLHSLGPTRRVPTAAAVAGIAGVAVLVVPPLAAAVPRPPLAGAATAYAEVAVGHAVPLPALASLVGACLEVTAATRTEARRAEASCVGEVTVQAFARLPILLAEGAEAGVAGDAACITCAEAIPLDDEARKEARPVPREGVPHAPTVIEVVAPPGDVLDTVAEGRGGAVSPLVP